MGFICKLFPKIKNYVLDAWPGTEYACASWGVGCEIVVINRPPPPLRGSFWKKPRMSVPVPVLLTGSLLLLIENTQEMSRSQIQVD